MPKRRANGEGSIYKRKDGHWVSQYTDMDGYKHYMYGKTQQEVKDKLKQAIRMDDEGISPSAGKTPFSKWIAEWLEVYARPMIRPSTYEAYRNLVYHHIVPAFPRVALKDIRESTLQRFLNEKLETRLDGKPGGYAPSFCGRLKEMLYSSLEKAASLGMIPRNPAAHLRLPPKKPREKQILTREQQRSFEAVAGERFGQDYTIGMYLLMLRTGMRVGEASALQLRDIDVEKEEIHIQRTIFRMRSQKEPHTERVVGEPKTRNSDRIIPLDSNTMELVKAILKGRERQIEASGRLWGNYVRHEPKWIEDGFIFLTVSGNAFDETSVRKKLHILLKKAGAPKVSPHALRHTFATRWIEAGLDVKSLADILGHADAKMTLNVYTHSLAEQKRESMMRLSQSLNADTKSRSG